MFETLLVNFLFLLLPVVIYLIFFENKQYTYNKVVLIFLSSLTMLLCMTIPIKLDIGFIFDLRYIPFIVVGLFGGYKTALPLYIVLNIYRFYLGGEGTIQSFLFSTVIFSTVPLLSKKFSQLQSKNRIFFATFVSFLTMGFYLFILSTFFDTLTTEFWILSINALTTHVAMMLIIMTLIERIMNNIKSRERLFHTERLSVIGELAASVSHEIRNPLTVTNGFLQLLRESRNLSQDEKRYVKFALQELNRAEKIVSDYLSLAKPQSENMVYSNLEVETEYTKDLITPYANMHQVNVQYRFTNSLKLNYDKNQIQQCMINLYKNAIEAMKEKGGGTLLIDISEQKQFILIKIQDTGIGMTKEEVLRLGNPFYSTKEKGTGLGMLMVYSTIDKLKGKVDVHSVKGKGTTFLITIPV